ncbi:FAD-binding protein [Rhizorhabdus dicambivorans]|uniref:FAD-binding protein n=1 Tax=Rhizorhabdus dicambivorans TaxID=1850238 RepID=UPI00083292EB|nr:FAD-binding protein [Rhizorhabdus dicambivorans]
MTAPPRQQAEPSPGSSEWFSPVEAPLVVDPAEAAWHAEADALVVGVGGAGICAALDLNERGMSVIAIDRFDGGGATGISGGIYYGGGTHHQKEAGYEETADNMFRYLRHELRGAVSDETIRKFAEDSNANLEWLEQHGVRFGSKCFEPKTPYPPDDYNLYYSGNEKADGARKVARPVPRGHRVVGPGFTGSALWGALRYSLEKSDVTYVTQAAVRRLVVDADGAVVGLEALILPPRIARLHGAVMRWFSASILRMTGGPVARLLARALDALERRHGERKLYRAHHGVILACGGFVHNRKMALHYAPHQGCSLPMGTLSCDGSGIRLGQSVGGAVRAINNFDLSRSITPPAYLAGIIVNAEGKRFIAEDAYNATIGHAVALDQKGKAWIIADAQQRRAARSQLQWPTHLVMFLWQLRNILSMTFGTRRSGSLDKLAHKLGIPADALQATVEQYRAIVAAGSDPLGKAPENIKPFGAGPYYAIDIGSHCRVNPTTGFSLGGLDVSEQTGQVLDRAGAPVPGLFAAGRSAYGVPSNFYVSGLAIADCVFSGRRAAASIASGRQPRP